MSYSIYLGKLLLPIAPSKIQLKISNKNKSIILIDNGEINILKKPGLTTIEFDALLPNVKYPFATYKNGFVKAKTYLNKLEELKTSQEPFQFIVTRTLPNGKMLFDTNIKVALEDYTMKEDVKNGMDVVVSVKLKQYRDYSTKTITVQVTPSNTVQATTEVKRETTNSPAPKTEGTTYTVRSGDTLWNIAKKTYGDGSRYPDIFNANKDKIKNANLIYPGQVLLLPV